MTLNRDILYALISSAVGVAISVYSHAFISFIADQYLSPYVYSRPMSEALFSLDQFYTNVDFVNHIAVIIAGILIATSVYFASRYLSRTTNRKHRMVAIVFATFIGAYGVCIVLANFL